MSPRRLGMGKMCSVDSVRRAIARMDPQEAADWLREHFEESVRPLRQQE